jgi:hypothetical protein
MDEEKLWQASSSIIALNEEEIAIVVTSLYRP